MPFVENLWTGGANPVENPTPKIFLQPGWRKNAAIEGCAPVFAIRFA
jgi:hypothetical protein